MPLKLVVCDLLRTRDDAVFITELCPGLSCMRLQDTEMAYVIAFSTLLPHGFKMLQYPGEPDTGESLLSHFKRDSLRKPFSDFSRGAISKAAVRAYLHKVFLNDPNYQSALWVMYFRTMLTNDIADKFAVILQQLLRKLKLTIEVIDAYSLGFACEHDKVLFWQLLKLKNSKLVIPKEIFRFSTFNAEQKSKLSAFLAASPATQLVIKPTNASLTHGVLVIPKEHLLTIIEWVKSAIQCMPAISSDALANKVFQDIRKVLLQPLADKLLQQIITLLYPSILQHPSQFVRNVVQNTVEKFVCHWLSLDNHTVLTSDRDFFLIEEFKAAKSETTPFLPDTKIAMASRAFFVVPNITANHRPVLGSVYSKRCYNVSKLSPDAKYLGEISFCENLYTWNLQQQYPNLVKDFVVDYLPRLQAYRDRVEASLTPPQEQAWMAALATLSVSDFIQQIKTANPTNRELNDYLASQSVQALNLENVAFCWHCFKLADGLKGCAACGQAKYCNADCQRADWRAFHKLECQALKERVASN